MTAPEIIVGVGLLVFLFAGIAAAIAANKWSRRPEDEYPRRPWLWDDEA